MAAIPEQNTAAQIGQAAQLKRYNDIPIDILPNDSFGRLYKPGTKTLGGKQFVEDTRQFDLGLQENKRASLVKEALAQRELDETIRANKANESYKWSALNRSGNSSAKPPTATEMLNAIRTGAIDFAQRTMKVTPYNADSPYNAVMKTKQLLNAESAKMPIALTPAQYDDIIKSVALAVGYEIPEKNNDLDALRGSLGIPSR